MFGRIVIPVEYIYQPSYREKDELCFFGKVKKKKYVFAGMEPYATVIGENNSKVSEYKSEKIDYLRLLHLVSNCSD